MRIRLNGWLKSLTGTIQDGYHLQTIRGQPVFQSSPPRGRPRTNDQRNRESILTNGTKLWDTLSLESPFVPQTQKSLYRQAWITVATGQPIHMDQQNLPHQSDGRAAAIKQILSLNHAQYAPSNLVIIPATYPTMATPAPTAINRTATSISINPSPFPTYEGLTPTARLLYATRRVNLYSDPITNPDNWNLRWRFASDSPPLFVPIPVPARESDVQLYVADVFLDNARNLIFSQQFTATVPRT